MRWRRLTALTTWSHSTSNSSLAVHPRLGASKHPCSGGLSDAHVTVMTALQHDDMEYEGLSLQTLGSMPGVHGDSVCASYCSPGAV